MDVKHDPDRIKNAMRERLVAKVRFPSRYKTTSPLMFWPAKLPGLYQNTKEST